MRISPTVSSLPRRLAVAVRRASSTRTSEVSKHPQRATPLSRPKIIRVDCRPRSASLGLLAAAVVERYREATRLTDIGRTAARITVCL